MPLSRLQPLGTSLERIVIPDDVALEALGLIIRNGSGVVIMTNYSRHRVSVAHWNGSVPKPRNAPIGVARTIVRGDIVQLDESSYEYVSAKSA